MVNEQRRCQNRDSQRRFRDRQRERIRQERDQERDQERELEQERDEDRQGGQQTQVVNPNDLISMDRNSPPVADSFNTNSNAGTTDLNTQEQDGLDDDFTRFLNSQEPTSRPLPWHDSSNGMGNSDPADQTTADESSASFLHPFDDTIRVARNQRPLGAPMVLPDASAQASMQTGGRIAPAHTHQPLRRAGADAPMNSTMADGPFQDEVFGPMQSDERQYLTPASPRHGPNGRRDSGKAYGRPLHSVAVSQHTIPRVQSSRPRAPSRSQLSPMRPSVSSFSNVRRAASSGGEVTMDGSKAFSQQLQQLLHETAQVYEAGLIMGYLEADDSFGNSIVWMKQRVASKLTGPLIRTLCLRASFGFGGTGGGVLAGGVCEVTGAGWGAVKASSGTPSTLGGGGGVFFGGTGGGCLRGSCG